MIRVPTPRGTQPLLAGVYEVTWREYLQSYLDGSCPFLYIPYPAMGFSERDQARTLLVNSPITGVSLAKIRCYTHWLKRKRGRTYRLPTPDEWVWIARGGRSTRFPWGNEWQMNMAAVRGRFTKPVAPEPYSAARNLAGYRVGQFPPNGYGLYDIMGNVSELTSLCRDGPTQKVGKLVISGCGQVVKDATWPEERAGIAGELYAIPSSEMREAGFRLVAAADGTDSNSVSH